MTYHDDETTTKESLPSTCRIVPILVVDKDRPVRAIDRVAIDLGCMLSESLANTTWRAAKGSKYVNIESTAY